MRALFVFSLLLLAGPLVAEANDQSTVLKIKVGAPELDKSLLLTKLNAHGADHGLRFEVAEDGYDYRIEFDTFQHRNEGATLAGAGAVHFSGAEVKVYDTRERLLFSFTRETRYTDAGATNAVAKEIIKRLITWQREQQETIPRAQTAPQSSPSLVQQAHPTKAPPSDAPLLGVSGYSNENGFNVTVIAPGSPADTQAHMEVRDIIVSIDGQHVHTAQDIELAIGKSATGTVKVSYLIRGTYGTQHEIKVR
jgi:hypothetical protein